MNPTNPEQTNQIAVPNVDEIYLVDQMGNKLILDLDPIAEVVMYQFINLCHGYNPMGIAFWDMSFRIYTHDADGREYELIDKNIEKKHPFKKGVPWSMQDIAKLSEMYRTDEQATIDTIAEELQRNRYVIKDKLISLGLMNKYGHPEIKRGAVKEPSRERIYGTC